MKTALVSLNVSYVHKNLALRWLMVTKPSDEQAKIFEGLCKAPLNVLDQILAYQPDVVALSTYIFNVDSTVTLIKALKAHDPSIKIVAGGPEATYHPDPLWDAGIDGIFRGETELVFWDVLKGIHHDGYQDQPKAQARILKADLAQLEKYPSPYFLEEDEKDMDKRYLYAESSRGCPYGCTYCMASLDRKVRLFSEEYMATFFERLKTTPVKQVKFLDRTFNLSKDRALRLARQCAAMPKGMNIHVELVGDALDEELKAIFTHDPNHRFRLEIGVQSLNPETLKAVGRHANLPKLLETISLFSKHDVIQHTDLIAGLPYEDLASFKRSYQGLIDLAPHEIQVGILKLLYGSALREQSDQYGIIADDHAPYQVRQTHWMSPQDIQDVEWVALATEKAYNSQKLKKELDMIFKDHSLVAFDVMRSVGMHIDRLSKPYSNRQFYLAVSEGLMPHLDEQKVKALINHAYLRNSPLCPPSLYPKQADKHHLNALREILGLPDTVKHLVLNDRIDGEAGLEVWAFGPYAHKTCYVLNEHHELLRKEPYETAAGHSQQT